MAYLIQLFDFLDTQKEFYHSRTLNGTLLSMIVYLKVFRRLSLLPALCSRTDSKGYREEHPVDHHPLEAIKR